VVVARLVERLGNRSPRQFGRRAIRGSGLSPIPERIEQPRAEDGIELPVGDLADRTDGDPKLLKVGLTAIAPQQVLIEARPSSPLGQRQPVAFGAQNQPLRNVLAKRPPNPPTITDHQVSGHRHAAALQP